MTQIKIAEMAVDPDAWLPLIDQKHKQRRPNPEVLAQCFTPAQWRFIESRHIEFRQHPRSSKRDTLELFAEANAVTDQDLTIAALLFAKNTQQ